MTTSNAFERVAAVIGEETDKAFKSILERLASGDITGLGTASVSIDEIRQFFGLLGGAEMHVHFACREAKGDNLRLTAATIRPQLGPEAAISGEISIGGTIRF